MDGREHRRHPQRGPSYKQIVIAPNPGGPLTSARTTYKSLRGEIASGWTIPTGGGLTLDATIPANTTAVVKVPAARAEDVTEGGNPLADTEGVRVVGVEDGRVVLEVGSGTYQFQAAAP